VSQDEIYPFRIPYFMTDISKPSQPVGFVKDGTDRAAAMARGQKNPGWRDLVISSFKFHLNRLTRGFRLPTGQNTLRNVIAPFIHVARAGDAALPYCVNINGAGLRLGSQAPWSLLDETLLQGAENPRQKRHSIRRLLAKLPDGASFVFRAIPGDDAKLVRDTFVEAGFTYHPSATFVWRKDDDADLITKLKANVRTQVRNAEKNLEVITIDPATFIRFYRDNLAAMDRSEWTDLDVIGKLLLEGLKSSPPRARIIGVRRKPAQENPIPALLEAAIACTFDDKTSQLWKITYVKCSSSDTGQKPHPHGIKLLVFEAMRHAAANGLTLDTDGFLPGAKLTYERFGILNLVERDEFKRDSLRHQISKRHPKVKNILRSGLGRLSPL
jgi:hypothetical protein